MILRLDGCKRYPRPLYLYGLLRSSCYLVLLLLILLLLAQFRPSLLHWGGRPGFSHSALVLLLVLLGLAGRSLLHRHFHGGLLSCRLLFLRLHRHSWSLRYLCSLLEQ
jgi:hypothetical protein